MPKLTPYSLFRKKPIDNDQIADNDLARVIGMTTLIFYGVGGIVGTGLFSITGIAISEHAGPAVILSFLMGAVACSFIGLCYSELASMVTVSGSSYSYTYIAFGEFIAWIVGWSLVLEYAVGAAAVAVSWSKYILSTLNGFGIYPDVRLISSPFEMYKLADGSVGHGYLNLFSTFIIILLTFVLMRGIKESLRINNIVVFIKIFVILTMIGFGAFYIDFHNYHPFVIPNTGEFGHYGFSGIMQAAGMIIFAYIGFDSVSSAAQEIKNPSKNIPRAILIIIAVCAVIYVSFACVIVGLVYYKDLIGDAAPVATAINHIPFAWLQPLVKLSVICGYVPILFLLLIGQTRIFYTLSKDGLIPAFFSKTHPKFKTPWSSHIFFMIVICLLSAFFPISILSSMCSIGALTAFVFVCTSVIVLRRTHRNYPRKFKAPGGDIIPIIATLTSLILMYSLNSLTWVMLLGWLAIGIVVYFCYGFKHSKLSNFK